MEACSLQRFLLDSYAEPARMPVVVANTSCCNCLLSDTGTPSIIVVEGVFRLASRDFFARVVGGVEKKTRPARGIVEITGPADGQCSRLRTIREHKQSSRFVPEPKQSSMPDDRCDLRGKAVDAHLQSSEHKTGQRIA